MDPRPSTRPRRREETDKLALELGSVAKDDQHMPKNTFNGIQKSNGLVLHTAVCFSVRLAIEGSDNTVFRDMAR